MVHGVVMETRAIAADVTAAKMIDPSARKSGARANAAKMRAAGKAAASHAAQMSASAKAAHVTAAAKPTTHMAAAASASTASATGFGCGGKQAGSNKSCCHYRYESLHDVFSFPMAKRRTMRIRTQAASALRIPTGKRYERRERFPLNSALATVWSAH
jgi:hypothetical protein